MKLVTFLHSGREKVGALTHLGIFDFSHISAELNTSMIEIIRRSGELLKEVHSFLVGERTWTASAILDEGHVQLLSPIPYPPSVRDGYAFRQHVETARKNRGLGMIPEFDQFPVFYFTNHRAIIGPGELRVGGRRLEQLDFELELAAVIGREIR